MLDILPIDLRNRHELFKLLGEKERRELDIQLFDVQQDILASPYKRVLLNAGRRGGKTEFLVFLLAERCINYPRLNCLYIAKSMESARSIVWSKFAKTLKNKLGVTMSAHDYKITFDNGSVIKLGGGDKDPDVHRGQAYDIAVIDEAAFIRDLSYLMEEVIEPALLDHAGTLYLASSPYGMNKFWEIAELAKKPDSHWGYFHWTAYDNPHIPKEGLLDIEKRYGRDSLVFRQEYLGEFVRHEGLVFQRFKNYAPHVIEPVDLNPNWLKFIGIDPGTTAPTGYVRAAYDADNDKLYVIQAENVKSLGNIDPIARRIQMDLTNKFFRDATVICDGHATQTIAELRTRYSIPVVAMTKKDVVGSYSRLISRLDRLGLHLFDEGRVRGPLSTKDLVEEILEAEWKPTRDENDESGKVAGSDHCIDALRYVNDYLFYKEIEQLREDTGVDPIEQKIIEKLKRRQEEESWDDAW